MKKTAALKTRNLVGRRIRQIRLALKPTPTLEDMSGRLANRGVQIDRSALGRIETGKRYVLDYELKALADALRTTVAHLFE